jgi:hypothetical protein
MLQSDEGGCGDGGFRRPDETCAYAHCCRCRTALVSKVTAACQVYRSCEAAHVLAVGASANARHFVPCVIDLRSQWDSDISNQDAATRLHLERNIPNETSREVYLMHIRFLHILYSLRAHGEKHRPALFQQTTVMSCLLQRHH